MKSKAAHVLFVIAMMGLVLFAALLGFESIATKANLYCKYQHELCVYELVGITYEELDMVQQHMAAYLRGDDDELENPVIAVFGAKQPIFNEREIAHMRDVRHLFDLERKIRNACAVAAIGLMLLMLPLRGGTINRRLYAFSGLMAVGVWGLLILGFAAVCGFDFETAFIRFHELLFTNDLWLLDPATDAMIRMYPQQFFEMMARDIGIRMGLQSLAAAAIPLIVLLGGGKETQNEW